MKKLLPLFFFILTLPAFAAVTETQNPVEIVEAIKSTPDLLVYFYDVNCPHCQKMQPLVDAYGKDHAVLKIKDDFRNFSETARRMKVWTVPTFIVFKNGREIGGFIGERPESEFLLLTKKPKERPLSPPSRPQNPAERTFNQLIAVILGLVAVVFGLAVNLAYLYGKNAGRKV